MLHLDLYTEVFPDFLQIFDKGSIFFIRTIGIYDHHHMEITLDNRLINIKNIDFVFCKICTYGCNNTYSVLTDNCNDCPVHDSIPPFYNVIMAIASSLGATLTGSVSFVTEKSLSSSF